MHEFPIPILFLTFAMSDSAGFAELELEDVDMLESGASASGGCKRRGDVVPAEAASQSGKGNGKRVKKSAKQEVAKRTDPCKICSCLFAEMPPGCSFCWPHKRTIDVMDYRYGKTSKDAQKKFRQRLADAPREPPSALASEVLEFEEQAPETDDRKPRNTVDMERHLERFTVSSAMSREVILQMMHQEQWLKNAVDVQLMPLQEAKDLWETVNEDTPEDCRDYKGPKVSQLRLPMPEREIIRAKHEVAQSREMEISSKVKKAVGNTVEQSMAYIFAKSMSFNDASFNVVGGGCMPKSTGSFLGSPCKNPSLALAEKLSHSQSQSSSTKMYVDKTEGVSALTMNVEKEEPNKKV